MNLLAFHFEACVKPDPIDPGVVYAFAHTPPGAIQRGALVKAWIREAAFAPRARRCALLMSPDAIHKLHHVVDETLARPLPAGEDGTASFRRIFIDGETPPAITDALVAARALFHRETGYWPKKILSRCHTPFDSKEEYHLVEHAHFDSYQDPDERYVMIAVLAGAGPVLIRNPRNELPACDDFDLAAFAAYADDLRRRYGAVHVRPNSIVLKKANLRGSPERFDTLPHLSGQVSNWPFWGKRVAFTLS